MTATISAAAVLPTGVVLAMVMVVMVALYIGIIRQLALDESCNRGIGIAGYAAIQLDTGCCQRHLCTPADTATDQHIHVQCGKDAG